MNALKSYQDQGLIPGVFCWIEESGRSTENVEEIDIQRHFKDVEPDKPGWRQVEPLPNYHVSLVFADGESMAKEFTPEQFRGE